VESQEIIEKISEIRIKNNDCWMKILSLAFKSNEKEAKKIMADIVSNDKKINSLSKNLLK